MDYQKNDCVTVTIEDISTDGEGIGKADGFTLFVRDAVIGDTVEARILKNKKNYAYARLEKVIKPSPYRVEPKCLFYRQCGGCQLQTLSYEKQLEFKQLKVRNHLMRIGGLSKELLDQVMEPIIGMEEPFHYRNKAQYPVGMDKNGKIITGFYAGRTHSIIANTDCALGAEENQRILQAVLDYMEENHVTAYEEDTGRGMVRHILIRTGFASGEIMVCLVIHRTNRETDQEKRKKESSYNKKAYAAESLGIDFLPAQKKLLKKLAVIPGMTSISVCINNEKTNVIMGEEVHCIWGSETIRDTIRVRDMGKDSYPFTGRQFTFHISPLSFFQVNPAQAEKLYSLVLEYAELTKQETVWDLYCGIGTISLFLAGSAKQVYGVEEVPQAVEDARENALCNGIENAEFFVGRVEEVLPQKLQKEGICADVIVVDPPRKGCDEECVRTIIKMQPEKILYVSCDSATLARDVKILCSGGYEVKRARAVDQFGMTVHVEMVVLMSKMK